MRRLIVRSLVLGALVLGVGVGGMLLMISMRKAPAEATAPKEERSIRVTAIEAISEDVVVRISGYGQTRPIRTVAIAPQISGSVIEVHPNLVVGGLVPKNELLFAIDARTYQTELAETEAQLARWRATLTRHETQFKNDEARLDTLRRTLAIAKTKYDRAAELFEQAIGNMSDVEEAEQHYNDTIGRVEQLEHLIALYPIRIEETRQSMAADAARKERAEINAALAQIRAPFDARITTLDLEVGHFAAAGVSVLELADDAALEIPVKLDAIDVRRWLRFDDVTTASDTAWFAALTQVPCEIQWTEDTDGQTWEGTLHRVEQFDPETRTLTVAVRIPSENACRNTGQGLPLVAGMFCEVIIPGHTLRDVYRLPQSAITVDNTVYLAKDGRLQAAQVEILHTEGGAAYVAGGIRPHDSVVTTRLINPLENTLLDIAPEDGASLSRTE